jgi:steroid 5-alpha reductase family enzyme
MTNSFYSNIENNNVNVNHNNIVTSSISSKRRPQSLLPRGLQRRRTDVSDQSRKKLYISPKTVLSLQGGGYDLSFVPSLLIQYTTTATITTTTNPVVIGFTTFFVADMVVGLLLSIVSHSHLHLDLIGTGVFALVALPHITSSVLHIQYTAIAVVVWATKLAAFLTLRAMYNKKDARLIDLLSSKAGIAQFWSITLVWNIITSLPMVLGWTNTDQSNPIAVLVGMIISIIGWTIETVADAQKWNFKQQQQSIPRMVEEDDHDDDDDDDNNNTSVVGQRFCNVGLWKYSQHPNFLGNLLLWIGILIMNGPSLIDPIVSTTTTTSVLSSSSSLLSTVTSSLQWWGWQLWSIKKLVLACVSPIFLWNLFLGQAKGTITNASVLAQAKYGNNPLYQSYLNDTPYIIPNLSKIVSSIF